MKPSGCVAGQPRGEPLGEPRAARVDADERGVVRDGALHALDERRERRLRVGQRRQASCGVVEPRLQDDLRGDRVAQPRARAAAATRRRAARLRASSLVQRSSTSATGSAKRALELAREARARARSSRARVPSACTGKPTTSRCRPPLVDQRARSTSTRCARRAMRRSSSADARRASTCCPTATPMRRVPKSNASTVASGFIAHAPLTRARRYRKAARCRCRAGAPRRAAGPRPAGRTATSGSASTVSHAFCASSCSSCPADHPA